MSVSFVSVGHPVSISVSPSCVSDCEPSCVSDCGSVSVYL